MRRDKRVSICSAGVSITASGGGRVSGAAVASEVVSESDVFEVEGVSVVVFEREADVWYTLANSEVNSGQIGFAWEIAVSARLVHALRCSAMVNACGREGCNNSDTISAARFAVWRSAPFCLIHPARVVRG